MTSAPVTHRSPSSILSTGLPVPFRNPRQVFVAYSYRLYPKDDYRKVYAELAGAFRVAFVFADERITDLHILQKIAGYIRSSAFGIYDISGWNPNVTLELGLAYGLSEKAFIAIDPSRTALDEVPADLRGIDRIQYASYTELGSGLERLLAQELPVPRTHAVEDQLSELRQSALVLIGQAGRLSVSSLAKLLGVSTDMARVVVKPMVGEELEITGAKRGSKYKLRTP